VLSREHSDKTCVGSAKGKARGRRTHAGRQQSEIENLDAATAAFQPQVARLDVAMNQPAFVSGRQSLGNLAANPHNLGDREVGLSPQKILQRLALEQRHGQEGNAVVLADLVDGHDVIVLQVGRRPRLAQKALTGTGITGIAGQHDFEGHRTLQQRVLGLVNSSHAALAQDLQYSIRTQSAQLVRLLRGTQTGIGGRAVVLKAHGRILGGQRLRVVFGLRQEDIAAARAAHLAAGRVGSGLERQATGRTGEDGG
jgi:hypothetical protein